MFLLHTIEIDLQAIARVSEATYPSVADS